MKTYLYLLFVVICSSAFASESVDIFVSYNKPLLSSQYEYSDVVIESYNGFSVGLVDMLSSNFGLGASFGYSHGAADGFWTIDWSGMGGIDYTDSTLSMDVTRINLSGFGRGMFRLGSLSLFADIGMGFLNSTRNTSGCLEASYPDVLAIQHYAKSVNSKVSFACALGIKYEFLYSRLLFSDDTAYAELGLAFSL